MAYDEGLAERIREVLGDTTGLSEKKMFGGIGYMIHGNMACGVNKDDLIVRVGADSYASALESRHTREFDMTGRPMTGWVVVDSKGCAEDRDLAEWIERGLSFARSLPPK